MDDKQQERWHNGGKGYHKQKQQVQDVYRNNLQRQRQLNTSSENNQVYFICQLRRLVVYCSRNNSLIEGNSLRAKSVP